MEESNPQVSVKSVSIKWGIISGLAGIIFFVLLDFLGQSNGSLRWAGLAITFAVIFLAHKEFKSEGDGFLAFGQGLGIGTLLSLVGSVISSIFTYIYVSFINTELIAQAKEQALLDMEAQGNTQDQIDQAMPFVDMMTSPTAFLIMGIVGGVFIGFIISIFVTIFTKKPNPEAI